MNTKKICNTLMLSSALFLTACGGGSGAGSDSNSTSDVDVSRVQTDLQSIQKQTIVVLAQLTGAQKEADSKKQKLDDLQTKMEKGEVDTAVVSAAETAYEAASGEVTRLEVQKADLAGKARAVQERVETLKAAQKVDTVLNNFGSMVLSGTLSEDQLKIFVNAVNTKPAVQLVVSTNKFIADIKGGLNTGVKLRTAFPKVISSPIIDSLVIPLMSQILGVEIQKAGEDSIRRSPSLASSDSGSSFLFALMPISFKKTEVANVYTLSFPLKEAIKGSTQDLLHDEISLVEYQDVLAFIDSYFRDKSTKVTEIVNLKLQVGKSEVLQADMQQLLQNLKPVVVDVLSKMPDQWVGWFSEMIQQIQNVDVNDMKKFKVVMEEIAQELAAQELSAEAPVSTSGNAAYRKARSRTGGVELGQLAIDGHTLDQSYALDMPLRVDLKGSLTSGKTMDVVGSVTYNMNATVVGVVQSYNNTVDLHSESSLLISQSMGNFFIEAQAGFVAIRESQFSGWEGQRYQATFGYDAAYVSPFIQFEYRPLTNGLSTLDAKGVYVGVESDVLNVQVADAVFTSAVLAKVGFESATETVFTGHSLRANQGVAGFVEWNGGLKLSSGLEIKSALTLGSKDNTSKLNIAFEQ